MPQSVDTSGPAAFLYVCRTCVRGLRQPPNAWSKGKILASQLQSHLQDAGLDTDIQMRIVSCLNGCVNPCNISLRRRDKYSYRFGGLKPGDEAAILTFAEAYAEQENGYVPIEKWDPVLKAKLTAEIPPPLPNNINQGSS